MAMMNQTQHDQYRRMPELGQSITKTIGTLDIQDDIDKFRKLFQAEYYAGFQYRKIEPIHMWSSANMIDMETRDEPGFLIAVSESQMRDLVKCGIEGDSHRKIREMNPAALAAWEEYMTIYHLTKSYER